MKVPFVPFFADASMHAVGDGEAEIEGHPRVVVKLGADSENPEYQFVTCAGCLAEGLRAYLDHHDQAPPVGRPTYPWE